MATKVHQLNNQYTKMKQSKYRAVLHSRKKRAIILISVFLIVMVIVGIQIFTTKMQVNKVSRQREHAERQLQNSKATNRKLKENISQLHNNDYIQKVIRQKYYYTKHGETVYSLPGDVSKDVTQN